MSAPGRPPVVQARLLVHRPGLPPSGLALSSRRTNGPKRPDPGERSGKRRHVHATHGGVRSAERSAERRAPPSASAATGRGSDRRVRAPSASPPDSPRARAASRRPSSRARARRDPTLPRSNARGFPARSSAPGGSHDARNPRRRCARSHERFGRSAARGDRIGVAALHARVAISRIDPARRAAGQDSDRVSAPRQTAHRPNFGVSVVAARVDESDAALLLAFASRPV